MFANLANAARRLVPYVLLFSLAACGGGGGGGGGWNPFGNNDAYTVTPTAFSFTVAQNSGTPPAQQASVRVNSGSVYIRVDYSGAAIANANFQVTGSTTGVVTINFVSSNRAPGTYSGTVTVWGCADAGCGSYVDGSPKFINVTYVVEGDFAVTPTSLNFSQHSNAAPPPTQYIYLTASPLNAWTATTSQPWVTLSSTSGTTPSTVGVTANPAGLAIGVHNATISVTPSGGTTRTVTVSFTVTAPAITVSTPTLTYAHTRGAAYPVAQSLTVAGTIGLNWTASADQGWVSLSSTSGTTPSTINIGVDPAGLAAGTYSSTVTFTSGALSASMTVWLTVSDPSLTTPSPASLSFSAFSHSSSNPSTQTVTLNTQTGASVNYTSTVTYGAGGSGWLTVPANGVAPGDMAAAVNTTSLAAGNYSATITLQSGSGSPINVAVSYQVNDSSVTVTPAQSTYTINNSSVAADLIQTAAVGDTGIGLGWTASVSVPWLNVSPTSGITAGNGSMTPFTLTLQSGELVRLDPGLHTGTVTFSFTRPDASIGTVQLPVTLNMNIPKLNFVSPHVALPNTSHEVIVRGLGFNHLAGSSILFGSNAVSAYNIVSDSEVRVSHPAMTEGNYQVAVPNQLGLNRSRASLAVVTVPTFTYAVVPSPGVHSQLIYDGQRSALYAAIIGPRFPSDPPSTPKIERHRFTGGGWVTDSLPIVPIAMAMTPDGRELVVTSSTVLYHIDLDSWTIASETNIASAVPFNTDNSSFGHVGIGNDGVAVLTGGSNGILYRYNVLTKAFSSFNNLHYDSGGMISSGDGSRIILCTAPGWPYATDYYDAGLGTLNSTGRIVNFSPAAYDRTGSTFIIGSQVFNRQFAPLGYMLYLANPAISSDGTRGYGYVSILAGRTLRIYDLTSPDGFGGFTEILPRISIPDSPGSITPPQLTISTDNRTVFIAGDTDIIVVPLP